MQGGWTKFRMVKPEEQTMFHQVMTLIGVQYEPFAVATQVVQGENYNFFCNAHAESNPPRDYAAQVHIFRPLPEQGTPMVVSISEIR